MIILNYSPKKHQQIIAACCHAIRAGKVVAYPTDTSYGLACDVTNLKAVKRLYQIKERTFKKPVHIIPPSIAFAQKIVVWPPLAKKLAKKFWPGALTLVLPLAHPDAILKKMSAGTNTVGLRMPHSKIAQDLARGSRVPISATSANPSAHLSGGFDSYSARDVYEQFTNQRHKPDIILNAGKLPRRKPSTLVKIDGVKWEIIRSGPVSYSQIKKTLS